MLQDAHSRKISIAVSAPAGDTVVVAGTSDRWIYVHELIGDMSAAGTFSVIAKNGGTEEILGTFTLADGQGLTLQDQPGEDNRPRFEFKPGYDFLIRAVTGNFVGAAQYSLRY